MAWPSALARTKNWGTETLTDSDLEGQLDLIIDYVNAALNSATGHKHDATASEGPKILTANINDSAGTAGDVIISTGTGLTRVAGAAITKVLTGGGVGVAPTFETNATDQSLDGSLIQEQYAENAAVDTTAANIPDDDTIPLPASEGKAAITDTITMATVTNILSLDGVFNVAQSAAGIVNAYITWNHAGISETVLKVFSNGETGARPRSIPVGDRFVPGTTNEITLKVYFGGDNGTATLNGKSGGRLYGGKMVSFLKSKEIKAS